MYYHKMILRVMCTVLFLVQMVRPHPLSLAEVDLEDTDRNTVIYRLNSDENGGTGAVETLIYPGLAEAPDVADSEDLSLAETHVFRPLFTYRRELSKRVRVKKLNGDDGGE